MAMGFLVSIMGLLLLASIEYMPDVYSRSG
jgi:hypothetical protein